MRRASDISLKASKLLDCPCSTGWAQGWCVLKALRARHFGYNCDQWLSLSCSVKSVEDLEGKVEREAEVLQRRRHEWSKRHYLRQRTLWLGPSHPSKNNNLLFLLIKNKPFIIPGVIYYLYIPSLQIKPFFNPL